MTDLAVVLPVPGSASAVSSASTTELAELHMNPMLGLWLIGPRLDTMFTHAS